jgi:hypothetical protein
MSWAYYFYNWIETIITYFMMMINEQYLYCMTWYTGTCGRTTISLLYRLDPIVINIYDYVMIGLAYNGCFVTGAPYLNRGHNYEFANSVGHPRSNSIGLLIYDGICTIYEAPMLYYKSLGIALTLLWRI